MGHRFSKTAANNIAASTAKTTTTHNNSLSEQKKEEQDFKTTNRISIPSGNNHFVGPTINLQIQESPNNNTQQQQTTCNHTTTAGILQQQQHQQQHYQQSPTTTTTNISSSLTSVNNLSCGGRQIIIKIQLAKMENGNEMPQQQHQHQDTSLETLTADCNLNSTELSAAATTTTTAAGAQILNLTLNSNSMPNATLMTSTTTPSTSASLSRTAGSSLTKNNNYLNSNSGVGVSCSSSTSPSTTSVVNNHQHHHHHQILSNASNERLGRFSTLQFNDEIVEQNIGEIVEYCEVLQEEQQHQPLNSNSNMQTLVINEEPDNETTNVCCRRKSKSLAAKEGSMSATNTTGAKTKSRCRKCSCRDAFRRILDPSLSRSSNKANKQQQQQQLKEQKRPKSQDRHSINSINPLKNTKNQQQQQRHTMHSTTTLAAANTTTTTNPNTLVSPAASTSAHRVSLWAPTTAATNGSDVVIPLTAPSQFVVVQCAIVNANNAPVVSTTTSTPPSSSSISSLPNSLITTNNDTSSSSASSSTSTANDTMVKVPSSSRTVAGSSTGPVVHSQVDFVHYLVPDLERITNSSFYWGKMDRYEAERLLEGKAEGTFLLRDSAQEEFLFSVTFRKYGRSLHARIEQSGHRFSFDCHDPCVFTAPTVTGLLEHYKDPACVMFFEPMLTIPLHRKNCFSLQKLCRATIVSNTTYDGINELELPARLKSYLKEYHYKQKLRVKSNEPTYTINCK